MSHRRQRRTVCSSVLIILYAQSIEVEVTLRSYKMEMKEHRKWISLTLGFDPGGERLLYVFVLL